jgi:GLPGLI family protein
MKYLLFICAFCINQVKAQKTYSIQYSQSGQSNVSINGQYQKYELISRLVYNDTLSFWYPALLYNKDKFRDNSVLGDKLIHHGVMYNRNNNEVLGEVVLSKRKYFFIVDTPRLYNWVFNRQQKEILGYHCNLAYSVSETNDTALVWYTGELGSVFGPLFYFGLPGIVLEVFDQQNGRHYLATKVERVSVTLVLPGNVKRITKEEYLKKQK